MALVIIPILKGDRELEVRTATYGPRIDQSQHAKSVSRIIYIYILSSQLPVLCKASIFFTEMDVSFPNVKCELVFVIIVIY